MKHTFVSAIQRVILRCAQFPWFEPYILDYIEALTHVRVLGTGEYGFVQLMTHNSRKNESNNKPQQLAVKSVFKAATTAKQFTAEKVRVRSVCLANYGLPALASLCQQ